jgi:hypothetical protein
MAVMAVVKATKYEDQWNEYTGKTYGEWKDAQWIY